MVLTLFIRSYLQSKSTAATNNQWKVPAKICAIPDSRQVFKTFQYAGAYYTVN